ncbi:hypothetical protein [Streptosporangium canum]|uniref:hypothetical protein n=1 Tax=Streptosporangium canum TaxID=324952 RepID=UPI00379FF181
MRSVVWTDEPDLGHLEGGKELIQSVKSPAYWCEVALTLATARAKIAEFVASDNFTALRDAYTALPIDSRYRPAGGTSR